MGGILANRPVVLVFARTGLGCFFAGFASPGVFARNGFKMSKHTHFSLRYLAPQSFVTQSYCFMHGRCAKVFATDFAEVG